MPGAGLALAWGWRRHREQAPCWHVLGLVFLFGLCLAWRDAPVLGGLNLMAIMALLILLTARPTRRDLHATTLAALGRNMLDGVGQAAYSPIALLGHETDWEHASGMVQTPDSKRVLRGLVFAVPLLIVFTVLFTEADAVFKYLVETAGNRLFDVLIDNQYMARHVLWSFVFFILAILLIRPVTLGEKWKSIELTPSPSWRLGTIELAITLGAVLALFGVFIAIQFRYLFGGNELVQTIPGLTYATYARKGFFALLVVVLLVHIVLTVGAWLVEGAEKRTQQFYRGLGLALVALTVFLFASAFFRMHLYVEAYGLTRLRFYAVGILLWLAVVFLILLVRLLRPRVPFFTSGCLYSLLAMLLLLNIVNPDGLIARVNLHRLTQGSNLDIEYLQRLSTDAIGAIIRYENHLLTEDRDALLTEILGKRLDHTADWRNWNYSRGRAKRQLLEYQWTLED